VPAAQTAQGTRLLELYGLDVQQEPFVGQAGRGQPVCTFLTKGPPSATRTQEGLAVLAEALAGAASPARARRLAERVEAVALAEAGGDFVAVYRFFLERDHAPRESYRLTVRVFRGGLPHGGPFTKDLCYDRGLLLICRYVQTAPARRLPLLFCGKIAVEEFPDLAELADEGLLAPPTHLPPFVALDSLADGGRVAALLERLTRPAPPYPPPAA
jgi:uncharacterized protein (TIGR02421 family)